MNAQDLVQMVQNRSTPMNATEVRKILDSIRGDAEKRLTAVLTGLLMYHMAHQLADDLEVAIGDAEATAQTMVQRYNKLQQQIDSADYAVRKAKADRIMLPSNAAQSDISEAEEAIRQSERGLRTARNNLQASKQTAQQRQRELKDLRAVHKSLAAVTMPDLSPQRPLLDELR